MHRPKNLAIKALATSALVTLALLGAFPAQATEMSTSTLLTSGTPGAFYACLFTNLGTKALFDVSMTLKDGAGNDVTHAVYVVQAGGDQAVSAPGSASNGLHCVVSGKFSKSKVRLNLQVADGTGVARAAVEGH